MASLSLLCVPGILVIRWGGKLGSQPDVNNFQITESVIGYNPSRCRKFRCNAACNYHHPLLLNY